MKIKIIKSESHQIHEDKINSFIQNEDIEIVNMTHTTVCNISHNCYGVISDIVYVTYISYIHKENCNAPINIFYKPSLTAKVLN